MQINLNKVSNAVDLKETAPIWVKDGVKERISTGISFEEAVGAIAKSPFFDMDWVVKAKSTSAA